MFSGPLPAAPTPPARSGIPRRQRWSPLHHDHRLTRAGDDATARGPAAPSRVPDRRSAPPLPPSPPTASIALHACNAACLPGRSTWPPAYAACHVSRRTGAGLCGSCDEEGGSRVCWCMRTPLPYFTLAFRGLPIAATLVVAGCATGSGPRDGTFRGIYVYALETSSFRACGSHEPWWLTGNRGPILEHLPPIGPPSYTGAGYIRVTGRRTGQGEYGHLGSYRYELVVEDVLELSPDTVGKCATRSGGD